MSNTPSAAAKNEGPTTAEPERPSRATTAEPERLARAKDKVSVASDGAAELMLRREIQFVEQRARELGTHQQALGAIVALLRGCADLPALGDRATAALQGRYGFVYGAFWTATAGQVRLCAEHGFINEDFAAASRLAHSHGGGVLLQRALRSGKSEILAQVGDLAECERASLARRAALRSCLVIPLVSEAGPGGAMGFYAMDTWLSTPERLATLDQIGRLLSLEVQRFHHEQAAAQRLQRAQAERDLLGRIVDFTVSAEASEGEINLNPVLHALAAHFDSPYVSFWLVERREHQVPCIRYRQHVGARDPELERIHRTQICVDGQGLTGRTWRAGRLFQVDEVGRLFDCPRVGCARRLGLHGAVCVPIISRGEVRGTFDIFSFGQLHLSEEMQGFLTRIGELLGASRLVSDAVDAAPTP